MKTNITKISGRYVAPTGKVVAIGHYCIGCPEDYDIDYILADEVVDVVTGERFGKELDEINSEFVEEKVYRLVKAEYETPEYSHRRHGNAKKLARKARVNSMVGVHWEKDDTKKLGKNRFLRRRIMPNASQQEKFESYLPF